MPNCTTTQKTLTKVEFFVVVAVITSTIYNIFNNTDIDIIQTFHAQFDANLSTLARLGNYTGILLN